MNTTGIVIPFKFVNDLTRLSWKELLFGISNKLYAPSFAIDHAIRFAQEVDDCSDLILELAFLNKGESVHPYVDELADHEIFDARRDVADIWQYLLLSWLYTNREKYDDPLQIVELIYSDFDYPENMKKFVRYMPSTKTIIGNRKANIERMYNDWHAYLEENSGLL